MLMVCKLSWLLFLVVILGVNCVSSLSEEKEKTHLREEDKTDISRLLATARSSINGSRGKRKRRFSHDYPDHDQSNLKQDYWGGNAVLQQKRTLRLRRLYDLTRDPDILDGLVNLLEAISQRPKMRTLVKTVVKKALALTMRDLSSALLDKPSSVEVIDTSADKEEEEETVDDQDDLKTEEIEDYF